MSKNFEMRVGAKPTAQYEIVDKTGRVCCQWDGRSYKQLCDHCINAIIESREQAIMKQAVEVSERAINLLTRRQTASTPAASTVPEPVSLVDAIRAAHGASPIGTVPTFGALVGTDTPPDPPSLIDAIQRCHRRN